MANHIRIFKILATTLLIIIALYIPLLLFVASLLLYRWVVRGIHRLRNPDSFGILSPQSSIHYALKREETSSDPTRWIINNCDVPTILFTVTVEGDTMDIHAFRALCAREIVYARTKGGNGLLFPEFQQYLRPWIGYVFWKQDPAFAIENHVKLYQNVNDWNARDAMFYWRFVREFTDKNFPAGRSPWETVLIENVRLDESEAPKSLIVFKVPHYFADGVSIFNVVTRLADKGAESVKRYKSQAPSRVQQILSKVVYPVKGPYDFACEIFRQAKETEFERRTDTDARESVSHRAIITSTQDTNLIALKHAAKKHNVPFTAVLLVCVGRALRRHLVQAGHQRIPQYFKVTFLLPSPNHPPYGMTNDVILATLHIPMHDAPFSDLLEEMGTEIQRVKRSTLHSTMTLISLLIGIMPVTWTWKFGILGRVISSALSSFPGPIEGTTFLERKVTAMNFIVSPGVIPAPVVMNLLTYNGAIRFSLSVQSDIVPQEQMHNLVVNIEEEFMAPGGSSVRAVAASKI